VTGEVVSSDELGEPAAQMNRSGATTVKPSSHSESSVVGQMGAFGQANYSASKGGIIAFTKTLALEMARYNITANSIACKLSVN
jgi:NAD(P)-dependent dehydrogenase (short-subunit alcohol dehydrogenase family)